MIVVGFCGRARTGKSTLCRELYAAAEHKGWDVEILPFAGPLKRAAEAAGCGKAENPEGYRKYCQTHGAGERAKNPDHWLNLWEADLKNLAKASYEEDRPLLVLADDVRYENELKLLIQHRAVVAFVKHGSRTIEDPNGEWRQHESEHLANAYEVSDKQSLYRQGFNYVIENDKGTDHLGMWAEAFVDGLSDAESCTCEGCMAMFEHRQFDVKKILDEIDKEKDEENDT